MSGTEEYKLLLYKLLQIIQLPSFVLYVLFIIVLIRYRSELASSFFDLSISVGVADICYTVISTFWRFVKFLPAVQEFSPSVRMALQYTYYVTWNGSFLAQLSGVVVLAINRFTAITSPTKYKKIWAGKLPLALAVCVQWAPSLVYIVGVPSHPAFSLVPRNTSFGYGVNSAGLTLLYLLFTLFIFVVGIAVIFLYGSMSLILLLNRRARASKVQQTADEQARIRQQRKEKAREVKLTVVGLILGVCAAHFAFSTTIGFLEFYSDTPAWLRSYLELISGRDFIFDFADPIVDIVFTLSNPYLILAISNPTRRCFVKFLRCSSG